MIPGLRVRSLMLFAAGVTTGILLSGCASIVAKILPVGQPVTKQRCEELSMDDFGYKDGLEARRPGDRYEFWVADCRPFGVTLDRAKYDQGYERGHAVYCSCEKGFEAGVKDQFTEFRGQYFSCTRAKYGNFLKGHAEGLKFSKDPDFVKAISPVQNEYNDTKITEVAPQMCVKLAEQEGIEKNVPVSVDIEVRAERVVSGRSVKVKTFFKNETAKPVQIAKWLIGDGGAPTHSFFKVYVDKTELAYQGAHKALEKPSADQLVTIPPGETVEGSFNLSKSYGWLSAPTSYTIQFFSPNPFSETEMTLKSGESKMSF